MDEPTDIEDVRKLNAQSRDPNGLTCPTNWEDVFVALDRIGVPEDFLSSTERAQEPPQKRDVTRDEPKR
jgi:hypothetical protein